MLSSQIGQFLCESFAFLSVNNMHLGTKEPRRLVSCLMQTPMLVVLTIQDVEDTSWALSRSRTGSWRCEPTLGDCISTQIFLIPVG